MAQLIIENFKAGLDTRRLNITTPAGTLIKLQDGHITRGGEIEKRLAFVSNKTLPSDTFGLAQASSTLYVFGSAVAPTMPSGVTYQRLEHPDGLDMASIVDAKSFDGNVYAIAKYSDDSVYHFLDGVRVGAWTDGVVTTAMIDSDGIATHLTSVIDTSANYSATSAASVVTITGANNEEYAVTLTTSNVTGGTDDQALATTTTQTAVEDVAEIVSVGTIQVKGGATDAGTNQITSLTVNGVSITAAAIDYDTSPGVTAAKIATQINGTTTAPDYTAQVVGDIVTIFAAAATGSTPNGFEIAATLAGEFVLSEGGFNITGGSSNPGTNKVSSVTVAGVTVTSAAVDWATSDVATAAAIASNITAHTSSPDYVATSLGTEVLISPVDTTGTSPATLTVVATVAGDVTTSTETPVNTAITDMSGGVDGTTGQPQISTVTVSGTYEVGDRYTVTLGTSPDDEVFGSAGNPQAVGESLLAFKSKLYSTASNTLYFSALGNGTLWNTNQTGAGFISMTNQAEGAEDLKAVATYQGYMGVFSRNAVQIWSMDDDETLNTQIQVLPNTGTFAPKSVVSFGDTDVFYLADSGVRSLRARDSSNAAFVSDVGTSIDDLVISTVKPLTDAQKAVALARVEPIDGRYWLVIQGTIFVFSFFPGSKISAWSTYTPGFTISDIAVVNSDIYCRSGDTIYLYGGTDGTTVDTSQCIATLPFLDAESPATLKNLLSVDVGAEGEWLVELGTNINEADEFETLGTITDSTFDQPRTGAIGESTHFSLRFTSTASAQTAKIGSAVLHYTGGETG